MHESDCALRGVLGLLPPSTPPLRDLLSLYPLTSPPLLGMTKDAKISRELTSCLFHALNDIKKIVDKYEKKLENAVLSSSGSSYSDSASG